MNNLGYITNEITTSLGDGSLNLGLITNEITASLGQPEVAAPNWATFWAVMSIGSGVLSAAMGYSRHRSGTEAIGFGVLGALFPLVTPAALLAFPARRRA